MNEALLPMIPSLPHGGDYNPEQWLDRPDLLEQDIRLMQKAGINTATLGVFSWTALEPHEGEYHFEWLTEIVQKLYDAGIYTVLATPSGARPAWLDAKYPEAMRVDEKGLRAHHGFRHNHCPSSPAYRAAVRKIDTLLAQKVGTHPGVVLWHISNEFGGECYCPLCMARFRTWLQQRYGTIEALNKAWWTMFWSHRYTSFEEVEPPFANGERSVMGLLLDWRRFTTWNTTDFMQAEIDTVRAVTPHIPATTNFMQLYPGLDYHKMAKNLDVISWDSYPAWHTDAQTEADTAARTAFDHAVMRGCAGGAPFLLMESAPGLVNWHPYNKLKRPGMHAAAALQAVACGADSVQYFQWRKGRGSFEQYHGAVLDHLGTDDTRVFREVEALGAALLRLSGVRGARVQAKAAMLFSWDAMWALQDMMGLSDKKEYAETCAALYRLFVQNGIELDVVSPSDDLTGYTMVLAPMLYLLREEDAARLCAYVQGGGTLLGTYATGYVDDSTLCYTGGFPGGGLAEVFGVIAEEIDTLYPSDKNTAVFADGESAEVREFAEVLRVQPDTQVLANYGQDFYADTPVITCRKAGQGKAYYAAARLSEAGRAKLLRMVWDACGITPQDLPAGVEYHCRAKDTQRYHFYINFGHEAATVRVQAGLTNLVDGSCTDTTLTLQEYGFAVLAEPMH